MSQVLDLWNKSRGTALGRWLCTRLVCRRAPYFASISPVLEVLEPGRCVAAFAHRRKVRNHIGTVHAIALCNAAELTAGLATDVSIPPSMRWIPKGMTVRYLKKAVGRMTATATLDPRNLDGTARDLEVVVAVRDPSGDAVLDARVTMYLSARRAG